MEKIDANKKLLFWESAISLQAVDLLKTSAELIEIAKKSIESKITGEEAIVLAQKTGNEADLVAARMFSLLVKDQFEISSASLTDIHKNLFEGILDSAGLFRENNIAKKEAALEGLEMVYEDFKKIEHSLKTYCDKENKFSFEGLTSQKVIHHIATFIANIWKIHPFERGNTRSVAIFFIKYLAYKGFAINNDVFAKHPVYFRNAVCRAAFCDKSRGIKSNARYFEKLLRNIIFNGEDKLNHSAIHLDLSKVKTVTVDPEGVMIKKERAVFDTQGVAVKKAPAVKKMGSAKKGCPAEKTLSAKKQEEKNSTKKSIQSSSEKKTGKAGSKITGGNNGRKTSLKNTEIKKSKIKTNLIEKRKPSKTVKKEPAKNTEAEAKIIDLLKKNKTITNSQARVEAEVSTETARRILTDLCNRKMARAEGKNKSRIYVLND